MMNSGNLWDARLQLHWAAQPAAGVGRALLPKRPDFSQESFQWSNDHEALLQGVVNGKFRSGIRPRDMTLLLVDGKGKIIDQLAMNGRVLSDGYDFYENYAKAKIDRAAEGLPEHPVADGARLNADTPSLETLHRYYEEANNLLQQVAQREKGAGPVLCWPHHFDIATLITISGSGENARTIGVGMQPGDSAIREPYYYVTPWPYPKPEALPPLGRGRWNTTGWIGAALPAKEQNDVVARFLAEAVQHCRSLLQ